MFRHIDERVPFLSRMMSTEQLLILRNHDGSEDAHPPTAFPSVRVDYIKNQLLIWKLTTQLLDTSCRDNHLGVFSFHRTPTASYHDIWRRSS